MAAMWVFFLLPGSVPEITSRPAEIALHLAGEFVTALALFASGVFALSNLRWGTLLLVPALGMLSHTLIVSSGYYLQKGEPIFVAVFCALPCLAIVAGAPQIRQLLKNAN